MMERAPLRRPMMFRRLARAASRSGVALASPVKRRRWPTHWPLPLSSRWPSRVCSVRLGALALLLFLDLRFPLLFWNLRHGLEVSGGEPTDWYYSMQRVGRITDIVGIFVLAALSFALH